MNPEWLRYYIAAKLNDKVEDFDFTAEDFVARVNSDLIGKYVNIASRAAPFLTKHFGGKLAPVSDTALVRSSASTMVAHGAQEEIAQAYANREYGKAIREIMRIADHINEQFDKHKPWELAKDPAKSQTLHEVCSDAIDAFRILTYYLAPILPSTAEQAAKMLGLRIPLRWQDLTAPIATTQPYQHLLSRVDPKQIDALFDVPESAPPPQPAAEASGRATISIDDFSKIDLRIARIVNAEHVGGADKLLKLTLDIGETENGSPRHRVVFAGIKSAYRPEDLIGRLTPMVANLAPRKMKFGVSEGMVLAASGDGPGIYLLAPDSGATAGMRVK